MLTGSEVTSTWAIPSRWVSLSCARRFASCHPWTGRRQVQVRLHREVHDMLRSWERLPPHSVCFLIDLIVTATKSHLTNCEHSRVITALSISNCKKNSPMTSMTGPSSLWLGGTPLDLAKGCGWHRRFRPLWNKKSILISATRKERRLHPRRAFPPTLQAPAVRGVRDGPGASQGYWDRQIFIQLRHARPGHLSYKRAPRKLAMATKRSENALLTTMAATALIHVLLRLRKDWCSPASRKGSIACSTTWRGIQTCYADGHRLLMNRCSSMSGLLHRKLQAPPLHDMVWDLRKPTSILMVSL